MNFGAEKARFPYSVIGELNKIRTCFRGTETGEDYTVALSTGFTVGKVHTCLLNLDSSSNRYNKIIPIIYVVATCKPPVSIYIGPSFDGGKQ